MNIKHILLGLTLVAVPVGALIGYSRKDESTPKNLGFFEHTDGGPSAHCHHSPSFGYDLAEVLRRLDVGVTYGPMTRDQAWMVMRQNFGIPTPGDAAFEARVDAFLRIRNSADALALCTELETTSRQSVRSRLAELSRIGKNVEGPVAPPNYENLVVFVNEAQKECLRIDGRAWQKRCEDFGDLLKRLENAFFEAGKDGTTHEEIEAEYVAEMKSLRARWISPEFGLFVAFEAGLKGWMEGRFLTTDVRGDAWRELTAERSARLTEVSAVLERIRFGLAVESAAMDEAESFLRSIDPKVADLFLAVRRGEGGVPSQAGGSLTDDTTRRCEILSAILEFGRQVCRQQLKPGEYLKDEWFRKS